MVNLSEVATPRRQGSACGRTGSTDEEEYRESAWENVTKLALGKHPIFILSLNCICFVVK